MALWILIKTTQNSEIHNTLCNRIRPLIESAGNCFECTTLKLKPRWFLIPIFSCEIKVHIRVVSDPYTTFSMTSLLEHRFVESIEWFFSLISDQATFFINLHFSVSFFIFPYNKKTLEITYKLFQWPYTLHTSFMSYDISIVQCTNLVSLECKNLWKKWQ